MRLGCTALGGRLRRNWTEQYAPECRSAEPIAYCIATAHACSKRHAYAYTPTYSNAHPNSVSHSYAEPYSKR